MTVSNINGSTKISSYIAVLGTEVDGADTAIEESFIVSITEVISTDFYTEEIYFYIDESQLTGFSNIFAKHATTLDTSDGGLIIVGGFAGDDLIGGFIADSRATLLGDLFTVYDAGSPSSIYEDGIDGGEHSTPTYPYVIDGGTF